jgi:REP element-mobilizing transposase RayT
MARVPHFSRSLNGIAVFITSAGCAPSQRELFSPATLIAMPWNLTRYYGNGDLHFITCSYYQRRPLLGSARRRDLFLTVLEQVRQRYQFVVLGYVVMPEHVHLLISEPQDSTPSTVMQAFKLGFAPRALIQMRRRRNAARVERPCFSALVLQATLHQFARLRIQHRDLLVARMQITPYNLHVLGSFLRALVRFEQPKFTRRLGADTVIESVQGNGAWHCQGEVCP